MKRSKFAVFSFCVYCGLMFWLLFIRWRDVTVTDYFSQLAGRIDLVPLRATLSMLRNLIRYPQREVLGLVVYNLGGNIVMSVPLGFYLPLLWPGLRRFGKAMTAAAAAMCAAELMQLVTLRGFCEIDDVLLNLIGAAIGYGLWRLCHNRTASA